MSEWIKVSKRLPDADEISRNHGCFIVNTEQGVMSAQFTMLGLLGSGHWTTSRFPGFRGVLEWQALPEPSKRESSFEQWWNEQPQLKESRLLSRREVQAIWDAAVAAAKGPDFVP